MATAKITKVINAHHHGGVNGLPPTAKYIGRPGPHGNKYSSKSGKFRREQCVAYHRLDLYADLHEDPSLFSKLKEELMGHDLACWCKNPKRLKSCHGDNFVHIFQEDLLTRDYTKSVLFYLMDDLRRVLSNLRKWAIATPNEEFLKLYVPYFEFEAEIKFLLKVIEMKKPHVEVACEYIAHCVILLELADSETTSQMKLYWMEIMEWNVSKILHPDGEVGPEPPDPLSVISRRKPKTAVV